MSVDIVGLALIPGVLGPVCDAVAVVAELVVVVEINANVVVTIVIAVGGRGALLM